MEVNANPWFIDAWAVHDGKVFASRRPADSIRAAATVFMSVPDLEPLPVGRISTALRATRSGFQEGFRDAGGAEIPFDSLVQVRDLVRRAYLAAGLGPGAPGAVAGPLPRPDDVGPGAGSAFLEQALPGPREPWTPVEASSPEPPPDLDDAVEVVVKASILEWDSYLGHQDPDELRGLIGWVGVLVRSGLMPYGPLDPRGVPVGLAHLIDEYHAGHLDAGLRLILERWVPNGPFWMGEAISGYWSRGHLVSVPLPRISRWPSRARRLVEMCLLPVIDRRFWTSPMAVTSLDLAPLVIMRAVRRPSRTGRLPGEPSAAGAGYERAMPLTWVELPDAAEVALAAFIDRCLDAPGPNPSPPPDAPTSFGPGSLTSWSLP